MAQLKCLLPVLAAAACLLLPAAASAQSRALVQTDRLILKRNYEKAAAVLQAAADKGDADAQFRLGNLHLLGLGVARDGAIARRLLQQSAAAGNTKAERLLNRIATQEPLRTGAIARLEKPDGKVFIPPVESASRDSAGNSWLVRAAARGLASAVAVLAAPERADPEALLAAAAAGQTSAAQSLIGSGTSVNVADNAGRTVLAHAAASRSPVLTAVLLEAGADAGRRDANGRTSLHHAIRRCNVESAAALLRNPALPAMSQPGPPYLNLALQTCPAAPLIDTLLPLAGASGVDGMGRSIMWYAAWNGHTLAAQRLIAGGADVSLRNADGLTALHAAAQRCNTGMLNILLLAGADANAATPANDTPLMLAAAAGCTDGVARLLSAGAAVDAANSQGDTALHLAVARSNPGVARLLLASGADKSTRNSRRETPLSLAERLGHAGVMAALITP